MGSCCLTALARSERMHAAGRAYRGSAFQAIHACAGVRLGTPTCLCRCLQDMITASTVARRLEDTAPAPALKVHHMCKELLALAQRGVAVPGDLSCRPPGACNVHHRLLAQAMRMN